MEYDTERIAEIVSDMERYLRDLETLDITYPNTWKPIAAAMKDITSYVEKNGMTITDTNCFKLAEKHTDDWMKHIADYAVPAAT